MDRTTNVGISTASQGTAVADTAFMTLVAAAKRVVVHGDVSPGFAAVREAFAENFARRRELGGACCVYRAGETVVDLWGGTG